MNITRTAFVRLVAGSFLSAAALGAASASTGETPPALDGAQTVSAAQAKAMLDKGGAIVLDVRRKAGRCHPR